MEYWKRPISPQVPNSNSELRTPNSELSLSLYPDACGKCHKEQYEGWTESLHSKAVGHGLLSQLDPHNDPETAASCYYCHAPMEEQAEVKSRESGVGSRKYIKNPLFDNKLKLSGVSCSVCHLREGKVYGPPVREIKGQGARGKGQEGHSDFIEKDFFEKAEFCAACHQLDEGYELNGKVLTNTYREWENSIYGKDNITCQSCHMPDRQHLWRGIHDPEMVGSGIHIEADPSKNGGRLVITNTAVGHFFPTYVTPLVIIKGFMLDKKGKVIPSSVKEAYIGRKVSLDLESEIFDTRIAPQKSFEFDYNPNIEIASPSARNDRESKSVIARSKATKQSKPSADKLVFEVWVYPDEFYNRFFKSMLTKNDVRKGDIQKAISATEKSKYRLFRKEITVQVKQ